MLVSWAQGECSLQSPVSYSCLIPAPLGYRIPGKLFMLPIFTFFLGVCVLLKVISM